LSEKYVKGLYNYLKIHVLPVFRAYALLAQEIVNTRMPEMLLQKNYSDFLRLIEILIHIKNPYYLIQEFENSPLAKGIQKRSWEEVKKELPEDVANVLDEAFQEWEEKKRKKDE